MYKLAKLVLYKFCIFFGILTPRYLQLVVTHLLIGTVSSVIHPTSNILDKFLICWYLFSTQMPFEIQVRKFLSSLATDSGTRCREQHRLQVSWLCSPSSACEFPRSILGSFEDLPNVQCKWQIKEVREGSLATYLTQLTISLIFCC